MPSGANSISKTLVPSRAETSDQVFPPSLERYSVPPTLPSGARPASTMSGLVVEAAASKTSPPGGPSEDQAPFPAGRTVRVLCGRSGTRGVPLGRFPCASIRRAGPELNAESFSENNTRVLDPACGEPARAANVLEIAARPTSRTQPPSNTTNSEIDRRGLEQKLLELAVIFIVRFKLLTS